SSDVCSSDLDQVHHRQGYSPGRMLLVPSVLHWQAKGDGYRRPYRSLQQAFRWAFGFKSLSFIACRGNAKLEEKAPVTGAFFVSGVFSGWRLSCIWRL